MIFLFLLMIRMQFVLMEGNFNNPSLLDGISYMQATRNTRLILLKYRVCVSDMVSYMKDIIIRYTLRCENYSYIVFTLTAMVDKWSFLNLVITVSAAALQTFSLRWMF